MGIQKIQNSRLHHAIIYLKMIYPKILPHLDRHRAFSLTDIKNIKELYDNGLNINQITKMYDKKYGSIQYIVDPVFCQKRKEQARAANAIKRLNPAYITHHRQQTSASHRYKRQVMAQTEYAFDFQDLQNWKRKNPTQYRRLIVRHSVLKKLKHNRIDL